jgi:hypothetical protein
MSIESSALFFSGGADRQHLAINLCGAWESHRLPIKRPSDPRANVGIE